MGITQKQQMVLDFLKSYEEKHGFTPTQRQIAQHFEFKSVGTVQDYLAYLEKHGHIQRARDEKRNLILNPSDRSVPLLGKVAAGLPIEHNINDEFIEVPTTMLKKGHSHFALMVKGDSMVDIGIVEGDYVVIRQQTTANTNGQIIVAQINNEAVIKRYFKKKGVIELHSENPKYKPIIIDPEDDFKILGVFVGLIRLN
ncbi:MAG: hypothetical protein A4S09_03465 [Proteobacteria bacterium SG_bin7]|nr:MAG: hypothetical protein A4S09_03465 [Proteobacteria bacterium SG_bin7]